jgi:molybdopterin converting factor small subunit
VATIYIPNALRQYTNGRDRIEVEGGGSLRRVIDKLEVVCPGLRDLLIEEDEIRPGIAFFVDDEMAAEGLIQRVGDDGTVHILPAIGGG